MTRLGPFVLALALGACRRDPDVPDEEPQSVEQVEPAPARPRSAPRSPSLVIADVESLASVDLSRVEDLDLAMSQIDGQERPLPLPEPVLEATDSGESETAEPVEPTLEPAIVHPRCEGLDLHAVAEAAPKLEALRVSGCQAAVHAGLSAFGGRLRKLELVDIELDAVTVARLAQLHGLEELILTRVHAQPDALLPLARKISPQTVVLRELGKDSPVAQIFGILPDIRHIRIEGSWATHTTMISVGKARRLESLALIETTIGNYSLHQVKPLDRLHRIEWSGAGFNDSTPVFLKDLPIDEIKCTCTRFGDAGLRSLRWLEGLAVLELERSDISSAGLVALVELPELRRLVVRDRTIDGDGFAALARLPKLADLTLSPGTLGDPLASHLGELVSLHRLELGLEGFGDAGASQLASLTSLEQLDLGGSSISDEGLQHLAPLVRLRELELHHTRVTKLGLAHLADMQDLEVLELDHTDVVDQGVAELEALGSLRELRLDDTLITDAALTHVAKLSKLERLNLANTVVSEAGLAQLAALPALVSVKLDGTRAQPD